MAGSASKKPSNNGKKKKTTKKSPAASGARKTNKKPTVAEAKRRAAARAEFEYQRRRFIKAIILFLSAIVLLSVFFISGEKLWHSVHELYHGMLGTFGFMLPVLLIYNAYQNAKDEPSPDYQSKTVFISLAVVMLSTTIYCLGTGDEPLRSYSDELHNSLLYSSSNAGPGVCGAMLGILFVKYIGKTGGGFIALVLFIVFLALSMGKLAMRIIDSFREPVKEFGHHLNDRREIRTQVREKENQQRKSEKEQLREEYIRQQVERRAAVRKKKQDQQFRRYKNTPFYEPDKSSPQAENNAPSPIPEQTKPKKKKQSPENKKPKEEANKSILPEEDLIFDQLDYDPEELDHIPEEEENDKADLENEPFFEPKPKKSKKKKAADDEPFEVNMDDNSITAGHYLRPPFNLLEPQKYEDEKNIAVELNQRGTMLVETLKSFGVQTSIVNISRGPAVTRYELQPASGVKISKITNLADDIAMNLAAIGVRIEAPIPGKSAVGIEVPNKHVSVVKMRNLVESQEFQSSKSNLTVALGKDITGKTVIADLARMPHLLIAGSTGSGKSVCVNSMLVSLLYKSSPDDVKLMLIDPKVVELGVYNGIPHLLVPVVTDPRKAAGALNWAVNEMLKRYKIFAEYNVRDMHSYNRLVERMNSENNVVYTSSEQIADENDRTFEEDEMLAQAQSEIDDEFEKKPEPLKKMPQILIVIDELADLMMAAPKDVEEAICRLAQMARAAGMHLVIATQRPSVDVITGLIKANVPSRIAFAVKSSIDSRTILDTSGAEKLLGRGDMLFSPIGKSKPVRVQGCFVEDYEIEGVLEFIKKSKIVEYDENVLEEIEKNAIPDNSGGADDVDSEHDPMIEEAIKCVVEAGQASTSMLQRRFRVGYARAGRLIDEMEQMGIVGPHEGSKPRQVLMTYQQWSERNLAKD